MNFCSSDYFSVPTNKEKEKSECNLNWTCQKQELFGILQAFLIENQLVDSCTALEKEIENKFGWTLYSGKKSLISSSPNDLSVLIGRGLAFSYGISKDFLYDHKDIINDSVLTKQFVRVSDSLNYDYVSKTSIYRTIKNISFSTKKIGGETHKMNENHLGLLHKELPIQNNKSVTNEEIKKNALPNIKNVLECNQNVFEISVDNNDSNNFNNNNDNDNNNKKINENKANFEIEIDNKKTNKIGDWDVVNEVCMELESEEILVNENNNWIELKEYEGKGKEKGKEKEKEKDEIEESHVKPIQIEINGIQNQNEKNKSN